MRAASSHDAETWALLQIDSHAYALCLQIHLELSSVETELPSEESVGVHEHGAVLRGGHKAE